MLEVPYHPRWTPFTELQQLANDLTELGDNATATLVRQAIDRFMAWKFEAGEELLEQALKERPQARTRAAPVALLQFLRSRDHLAARAGRVVR